MSDIGAFEAGRWQFWHERWRIGATSFVKVTGATADLSAVAPCAEAEAPCAKVGAFGTIVTIMTSAAAAIVRALMPASTVLADLPASAKATAGPPKPAKAERSGTT